METGVSFSTLYARRLPRHDWHGSETRAGKAPERLERSPAILEDLFLDCPRRRGRP
jgi:hypothetical protein